VKEKIKKVVEEYQCLGCVCGSNIDCYKKHKHGIQCSKHIAGTMLMPHIGTIFLGLPTGFNRLGQTKETKISIFENFKDGWGYNKFNVPVWKHLDKYRNTLVRGISPRINMPWIHIFLGNVLSEIECLEITQEDINEMD
jgi:hypothetical protein